MNILITGALRGLGAELVKIFLDKGHNVFAGVLSMEDLYDLDPIKDNKALKIFKLDVTCEEDIANIPTYISEYTDTIDIVINNAGVLLNREDYIIQDDYNSILTTFKVNTIGPIAINNVIMPFIEKSENPTIINITSEVKAIDAVGPKFATYSMSKTALAQYSIILKRTLDELGKKVRVFGVHPGRMKTVMGAENGQIEASESAQNIYKLACGQVLKNNEHIYIDYTGEPMI